MGIVFKQSLSNLFTTYFGFAIGALNTLYLYVNFMSDEYFGLVGFITSTAFIVMPFMAFGVQNTLIKFYSNYEGKEQDRFLRLMLLLPILVIVPATIVCYLCYEQIASFLASENAIVTNYVWYIFLIAVSSAYFELFFSWAKVQLKSIFGNFMKEVFHRLGVTILLIFLAQEIIDIHFFLKAMVGIYLLRMFIMMIYAFSLKMPRIRLLDSRQTGSLIGIRNYTAVLKYTVLIIIAGSIATVLLDIDKVMIGKQVHLDYVAYYGVAIYIATVIIVPVRAMHQITYPLVAKMLNTNDKEAMADLYKKSSITLFIVSSLLYILIVCNLDSLYEMLSPQYRNGYYVVLFVGAARVFDNVLGINNAILFNSDYYRTVLYLGLGLVVVAIVLNLICIPIYGINGAAIATFISILGYAILKMIVTYKKFNMHPFSAGTVKIVLLLILFLAIFYFWNFSIPSFWAIICKSALIVPLYMFIIYRLHISEDINQAIRKILP